MSKRVIVLIVVLVACVGACSGEDSTATHADKRPNIVLLLTDDLDMAELKFMPHVERLIAEQGLTFDASYVSNSICCPSRSTILTGRYAHNTGVETNGGGNGGFEVAHARGIESSTVGTWLQAAGYRTAYIGKYLNGYPHTVAAKYEPPGWNEWSSAVAGDPYGEYGYTLNRNGKMVEYGRAPVDYGTDVYMAQGERFIKSSRQPFLLYLNVYAPHQPAVPAPQDIALFPRAVVPRTASFNEADIADKPAFVRKTKPLRIRSIDQLYRNRIRSLQAVDRDLVQLVDTLRTSGQLANTYFFFASDNGFHLGQHRLFPGKGTAYETDIRVPLIVRGPGISAGTHTSAPVGNVDWAETFAALAGANVPATVDGRSFAAILHHPTTAWPRHAYLLEHWQILADTKPPPPPGTVLEPLDPNQVIAKALDITPHFVGIRTARYTYVEYVTGERELYDNRVDPEQLQNIYATAAPALVGRLHHVVVALSACQAARCRTAEAVAIP